MKHRNPFAVFFLSLITLGIYAIVWQVKTKNEMNALGAEIPTAWLLIIPLVNYYWLWKYSQGVEKVSGGKTSGVLAFVLLFLLGVIGMAIIQDGFNNIGAPVTASTNTPPAPVADAAPVESTPDASVSQPAAPATPDATPAAPSVAVPVTDVTPPAPATPPASEEPATPPSDPSQPAV